MKVLVLVEDYPNNNKCPLMYVHVRNKYYLENGMNVTVLNFKTKSSYEYDNITVISLNDYKKMNEKYDILVCHAANLKHHYVFLKKYGKIFKNIVFFFHGHEVLKVNKVYAKPYKYVKSNILKVLIRNIYDSMKLKIWKKYYTKIAYKSYFIFVSKWMYNEFLKWTKIPPEIIENRYAITYNCVGKTFENENFNYDKEKKYDFITIRANLDGAKYSVDIVNELAKNNPKQTFLLIGKGKFFNYNKKAENLIWFDKTLNHDEIIKLLNQSKCALMPTKTDAQGLMMCEMATFGIPVITSDLPVCHEIFDDFKNVGFINNDNIEENKLKKIYNRIKDKTPKNKKYFNEYTSKEEIKVFKDIYERSTI